MREYATTRLHLEASFQYRGLASHVFEEQQEIWHGLLYTLANSQHKCSNKGRCALLLCCTQHGVPRQPIYRARLEIVPRYLATINRLSCLSNTRLVDFWHGGKHLATAGEYYRRLKWKAFPTETPAVSLPCTTDEHPG